MTDARDNLRPPERPDPPGQLDEQLAGNDRLPGRRDALVRGSLPPSMDKPQGDENRDPPPGAPSPPPP